MDSHKTFSNRFNAKRSLDHNDRKIGIFDQMIGQLQGETSKLDVIKHIDKSAPLFKQIYALVEGCESFNNHNDSFIIRLKENLLSIANIDQEKHYGHERQELMEIYKTDEKDIDQEFENDLEEILQEIIRNYQKEILQELMEEVLQQN
jgi:hypothetical protein